MRIIGIIGVWASVWLLAVVGAGSAYGANYYWDTANTTGLQAGNGTWATGTKNWNTDIAGVPNNVVWPNPNEAIFLTAGTSAITVSGTVQVNAITFSGTGYTVGGTALTLTGAGTITTDVAGTINAPIAGTVGITKAGADILTLGGTLANTYSGLTTVNVGRIDLNKTAGTNAITGNLTIGDGTGGANADEVRLLASNQIADTSNVTINSSGLLALGAFSETVNDLTMNGGSFTATSGTLTVNNLSGAGTVGKIIVNGGVTPGASPGTLNASDTFTLGGASTFEINDPGFVLGTYDLVTGQPGKMVTFGGTLHLVFDSGKSYANGTAVLGLFTGFGTYSGSFTDVTYAGLAAQQSATFNSTNGTISIIPEPASGLLLALGVAGLFVRRRR